MKKAVWSGMAVVAAVLCFSTDAQAQSSATGEVNISVTVSARAKLTLGAASIAFPDADPDVSPSLVATPLSIAVKARTSSGGAVTLTVQADGPLTAGVGITIPISALTWTAGGAGYVAGTANSTTAQSVGAFTGSNNHAGTQTFALANSWAYTIGTYSAKLNYTLSAP